MNHDLTFSEMLRIEDSKDLLDIRCPDTGIPLWSIIRVPFFNMVISDLFYSAPLGGSQLRVGVKEGLTILRSFAHNAISLGAAQQRFPIIIMATGVRLMIENGKAFNTLSDHFASVDALRTLTIEDLFNWRWPFPRHNGNILIHTPLRVEGALKGRMRLRKFKVLTGALLNLACDRAKQQFGWEMGPVRRQKIEWACIKGAASIYPRFQEYRRTFNRTGARLLIKEEACYGGSDNVAAIFAARDMGIVTAEYQHGMISLGHPAYNYAPSIVKDSDYQKVFPDYFLSYGEWWSQQMNVPSKMVTIGQPHRTQYLETMPASARIGRQVLVLGDGVETEMYMDLCRHLSIDLKGFASVLFRPHPLERANVRKKFPEGHSTDVQVDSEQDIYSSFRKSFAVVGEVSTGLFEAIGLVQKVFIWNTPKARFSYPRHPFEGFSNSVELAKLILDKDAGNFVGQQMDPIWAPNWKRNYRDFLEKVV